MGDETNKLIEERNKKNLWIRSLPFTCLLWPQKSPNEAEVFKILKGTSHSECKFKVYNKTTKAMEDRIRRLVDSLERTGPFDDRTNVFTSDKGNKRFSDKRPFICVKTEALEGSIRVLVILSRPNDFKATSGRESIQFIASIGFFATLLRLVNDIGQENDGLDSKY